MKLIIIQEFNYYFNPKANFFQGISLKIILD